MPIFVAAKPRTHWAVPSASSLATNMALLALVTSAFLPPMVSVPEYEPVT
ncbi:MAG: hypothetical protein QM820_52170 [Minicystis sp.]